MNNRYIYILLLTLFFFGCNKMTITEFKEYSSVVNNVKNGLVISKNINDLIITAKYMPPEYSAYIEYSKSKNPTSRLKDSLISYYSNSYTFLLTIAVNEDKNNSKGDLLMGGVDTYEEYKSRLIDLTFNLGDYIDLQVGSNVYEPVLSTMVNDFGLTTKKQFYIVYAKQYKNLPEISNAKQLDLIFYDEIFNTGKSHFVFSKEEIDNIPKFDFK